MKFVTQRKRLKNSKRNISKTWKIWQDRNTMKEHTEEENCQGGLQQENYSDGQIRDTTKNTREDWRRIGDSGRENDHKEEKWK